MKHRTFSRRTQIFAISILTFTALAMCGFIAYRSLVHTTIGQYADIVFAKCRNTPYRPSCYDSEIPKLMRHISMEDAFDVTRNIQAKDPQYLYCHVLAHKLSYEETSKDLSKWKDVVTRCPTTFCNNGCQHGAVMRRFNAENLTDSQIQSILPDLKDVCEPRGKWNPREVERSMCYHALGHLHMYITKADIPKSVALCTTVGVKSDGRNYEQTCTQGVLMTIYQPLEPEDYALVKSIAPSKETVNTFCDQLEGEAWFACHSESWPLFFSEIQTPSGLMRFCSYTEEPEKKRNCIDTGMGILTVSMIVDNGNKVDTLKEYCDQLPLVQKSQCYAGAAFRLIQIDPRYTSTAVSVCESAQDSAVGDDCFSYALLHAKQSFQSGSKELDSFCDEFPQKWRISCRR